MLNRQARQAAFQYGDVGAVARHASGSRADGSRIALGAAETGCARDVAEAALAHAVRDKTEAAYLRTDHLDARRPLMAAWADHASHQLHASLRSKTHDKSTARFLKLNALPSD